MAAAILTGNVKNGQRKFNNTVDALIIAKRLLSAFIAHSVAYKNLRAVGC